MSIEPKGEELRKAVKWISEMRQENPEKPVHKLVEEASLAFDLAPDQQEFLYKYLKDEQAK